MMAKAIRALALAFGFAFAAPALAQGDLQKRVVGTWHEYTPTDNLITFARDGSWKLYLKKGEVGELRTLGGKWWVEEGMLIVVIIKDNQHQRTSARLSFEGEELVLTDAAGVETRHRRHQGPIPKPYRW
jgi:hypothetical protein